MVQALAIFVQFPPTCAETSYKGKVKFKTVVTFLSTCLEFVIPYLTVSSNPFECLCERTPLCSFSINAHSHFLLSLEKAQTCLQNTI